LVPDCSVIFFGGQLFGHFLGFPTGVLNFRDFEDFFFIPDYLSGGIAVANELNINRDFTARLPTILLDNGFTKNRGDFFLIPTRYGIEGKRAENSQKYHNHKARLPTNRLIIKLDLNPF